MSESINNLGAHLENVKRILENAEVPTSWYCFPQGDDYQESRICIASKADGIHVFIRERGAIWFNEVFKGWRSAAVSIANLLEPQYTQKIRAEIVKLIESGSFLE